MGFGLLLFIAAVDLRAGGNFIVSFVNTGPVLILAAIFFLLIKRIFDERPTIMC
jgi:uncharacterized transporter YbjL